MKNLFILFVCCIAPLSIGCAESTIWEDEVSPEQVVQAEVLQVSYNPQHGGLFGGSTPDYTIIFQGEKGKFVIEGSYGLARELWNRLKGGEKVTVRYRDIYTLRYEKKKLAERYFRHREYLSVE